MTKRAMVVAVLAAGVGACDRPAVDIAAAAPVDVQREHALWWCPIDNGNTASLDLWCIPELRKVTAGDRSPHEQIAEYRRFAASHCYDSATKSRTTCVETALVTCVFPDDTDPKLCALRIDTCEAAVAAFKRAKPDDAIAQKRYCAPFFEGVRLTR